MYQYRSEANRFDRDFAFEITKKSEHSFFLKTKGKKRKCSITNYRSFAITISFTCRSSWKEQVTHPDQWTPKLRRFILYCMLFERSGSRLDQQVTRISFTCRSTWENQVTLLIIRQKLTDYPERTRHSKRTITKLDHSETEFIFSFRSLWEKHGRNITITRTHWRQCDFCLIPFFAARWQCCRTRSRTRQRRSLTWSEFWTTRRRSWRRRRSSYSGRC